MYCIRLPKTIISERALRKKGPLVTYKNITRQINCQSGRLGAGVETSHGARGRPAPPVTDTNRADLRALEPHWNLSDSSIYVSFYLFRSY